MQGGVGEAGQQFLLEQVDAIDPIEFAGDDDCERVSHI